MFGAARKKTRLWLLILVGVVATLLGQTHARQVFDPSPHESGVFATQTQATTGDFYDADRYDAPDSLLAAKTTARTNFSVYETLAEVPISGAKRGAHRRAANTAFARQLEGSAELQGRFNQLLGKDVLEHMNSGAGRNLINPPGAVWHHPVDNPGVLQLLRSTEHTNPLLQPVLHPSGIGGFGTFYGP